MEFEFKAPIIVSKTPSTVYAFQLMNTYAIDKSYDTMISYSALQDDNIDYIKSLIHSFCVKCSKYFSKSLEQDKLLSRLTHNNFAVNELNNEDSKSDGGFIHQWKYTPYRIIISGTQFCIEWCIDEMEEKCIIDIPDISSEEVLVDNLNNLDNVVDEPLVQLSDTDIPVSENEYDDIHQEDLLKKLKKARLRVKIAKFKAEQAYEKYVKTWGYLSEDSGSDSD